MLFLCNVKTNTICFQFSQFGQHNCCVICLRKLSPLTEVISTSNGVLEASLAPWDWVGGWCKRKNRAAYHYHHHHHCQNLCKSGIIVCKQIESLLTPSFVHLTLRPCNPRPHPCDKQFLSLGVHMNAHQTSPRLFNIWG